MPRSTFEVSGAQMLQLLKDSAGKLHRWDIGFFCLSPQPADHVFGDSPKEPWVGTVMFQQMVAGGMITAAGELAPVGVVRDDAMSEKQERIAQLKAAGATFLDGKVILYRGADVPRSVIAKLRYGDYLSAVEGGEDANGNAGAASYGKNVVRFELPVEDVIVTGAGEFQYKGRSESLANGHRYPPQIYRAYNDAYGSNYTAEQIDGQDNVRAVASQALPGGREEFDELLLRHEGQTSPNVGRRTERPRG